MASDRDTRFEPDQPDRDDAIVRAEQRVVNTQGGDYAEGTLDKRQGTFVEGDQVTLVTEEQAYLVAGLKNPYLGLRAFTYDDRASFAGREVLRS